MHDYVRLRVNSRNSRGPVDLETWNCSGYSSLFPTKFRKLCMLLPYVRKALLNHLQKVPAAPHSRGSQRSWSRNNAAVMGSNADSTKTPPNHILFAFDFDHTIVEGNTDTHVIKAHPAAWLPAELKASYQNGRW